jgi:hypothetical protein
LKSTHSRLVSENIPSDTTKIYQAYTLVDITDSRVYDFRYSDTIEYHQYQNLNVLLQLLSFRTQATIISVSVLENQDLRKYRFGKKYKGKHRVWQVDFVIEPDGVWQNEDDEFYFIKQDADEVAVAVNLTETAHIEKEQFLISDGYLANLYFSEKS